MTGLTRRQKLDDPLLEVTELNVVTRADDTGLVDAEIVSSVSNVSRIVSIHTGRSIAPQSCHCGGHRPLRILQCNLPRRSVSVARV